MSLLGRLFSRGGMEHYRRGIMLFNQEQYERAAREFELALERMGDPSDPYHNLGRFYAAEAHAKLGLSLQEQGHSDQARLRYERALAEGYRYPDLHYSLARILESEGDQMNAEVHLRAALELNGSYLEARALLAVVLWNQGRAEEALQELKWLSATEFRLPPRLSLELTTHLDEEIMGEIRHETVQRQRSQLHLKRALDAYDQGDRSSAVEEMRQAVAQNPGYADLRCKLGILYAETGALELAGEELHAALRINPKYVEARLQLGLLLLRLDRPDEAREHLQVAAQLQPQYPDVLLFRGVAELRQGDLRRARETIEEALAAHPGFHRARYFLGLTLACLGESEASLAEMKKALEGDPDLIRARADLAQMHLRRGEKERAQDLFRWILDRHPEFPDAHLGLGLVLLESGQVKKAREHLTAALQLNPHFVRALESLARLEINDRNFVAAEELLGRALQKEQDYPDLHYLHGRSLEGLGREAEAISAFERALVANPSYVDARLALGLALLRKGEGSRAREEMGTVLRHDPTHPVARALADPGLLGEL